MYTNLHKEKTLSECYHEELQEEDEQNTIASLIKLALAKTGNEVRIGNYDDEYYMVQILDKHDYPLVEETSDTIANACVLALKKYNHNKQG